MSIQIITDSASDIINPGRDDVTILPMAINFGANEYLDGVTLTHKEFYEKLVEEDDLPVTSQVSPYTFGEAIRKVHEAGDIAIVITLSGKLSGTYQSAHLAAQDFPDTAFVVDSESVAVGERALVAYALQLKDFGMDAQSIVSKLETEKKHIHIVALLDTLEYLKKGGRISKTVAFAGNILSIKPVVGVEDGEVVILGKARGSKQGNNILIEQIQKAGGIDFSRPLFLGYTGLSDALIQKYIIDSEALWKDGTESLSVSTIGGTIGTHTGPGAIAVAFFAKEFPVK